MFSTLSSIFTSKDTHQFSSLSETEEDKTSIGMYFPANITNLLFNKKNCYTEKNTKFKYTTKKKVLDEENVLYIGKIKFDDPAFKMQFVYINRKWASTVILDKAENKSFGKHAESMFGKMDDDAIEFTEKEIHKKLVNLFSELGI